MAFNAAVAIAVRRVILSPHRDRTSNLVARASQRNYKEGKNDIGFKMPRLTRSKSSWVKPNAAMIYYDTP